MIHAVHRWGTFSHTRTDCRHLTHYNTPKEKNKHNSFCFTSSHDFRIIAKIWNQWKDTFNWSLMSHFMWYVCHHCVTSVKGPTLWKIDFLMFFKYKNMHQCLPSTHYIKEKSHYPLLAPPFSVQRQSVWKISPADVIRGYATSFRWETLNELDICTALSWLQLKEHV